MFGATQRRLRQLSEGVPGPVANKATKVRDTWRERCTWRRLIGQNTISLKMRVYLVVLISSHQILRQFEALMGGSPHGSRQDTANSSHQATNQLPTSTYSDPLLATHSADNTNLNHGQPNISPTGVTQPQNHPSPPTSLALAQRGFSEELTNDGDEEKLSPVQQESVQNQEEPVRTAEVELVAEEPALNTDRCSSPPAEPQSERPCLGRLSLFSGMELVTKGRPLCKREPSQTETDTTDKSLRENLAVPNRISTSEASERAPSICNSVASNSSQPVSAFSFLNFWPTFYSWNC